MKNQRWKMSECQINRTKSFFWRKGHRGAGFKLARQSGKYIGQNALPLDGQADQAAGMLRHEVDSLGRDLFGGHHQVALVLARGIVNDDDELAAADVFDCLWNGYDPHFVSDGS